MWQKQKAHYHQNKNTVSHDKVFALTHQENQTQKLYAVSPSGLRLGLEVGMTLAHARAVIPDLNTSPANPVYDQQCLSALAHWAIRYSPLVAVDGEDGLLLDITGCDHLFGGLETMLQDMVRRLHGAGLHCRLALAETIGAAWGHARRGGKHRLYAHKRCDADLPVQALRLPDRTIVTLRRLGLKNIGQLLAIPRPALARRFRTLKNNETATLIKRLDQFTGREAEALTPLLPYSDHSIRHSFVEPVQHVNLIEAVLPALLAKLCTNLAEIDCGIRRLAVQCFRVDGTLQTITVGTHAPSREPTHLMRLINEHLPTLDAGFGFDLLILNPVSCEPLLAEQVSIAREVPQEAVTQTLDRLSARLGRSAVLGLYHRHSHTPEKCQYMAPYSADGSDWQDYPDYKAPRPIRLLERPEHIDVLAEVPEGAPRQFRWRRLQYRVTKAEGPERITHEWWEDLTSFNTPGQAKRLTRDYYKIEVEDGARFWLFRRGLYDVPGLSSETSNTTAHNTTQPALSQHPSWFMHGFFA